jgi:uncharacterized YigZ family protein
MQTKEIKKYLILDEVSSEYEVKRNRFIGIVSQLTDTDDIKSILKKVRSAHPKARHICHAYIVNTNGKLSQGSSDDGEPQGTAGRPMLQILEYSNLIDVLAIVIRYSSGVKLGAAGLIRTYSKVVKDSIDLAQLIPLTKLVNLLLSFEYSLENDVRNVLRKNDVSLMKEDYTMGVSFVVEVDEESLNSLKETLINVTKGRITIEECEVD